MVQQTKIGRVLLGLMAVLIVGHFLYAIFHGLPATMRDFIIFPLVGVAFCLASAIYLMGVRPALILLGLTAVLSWLAEEIGVRTGLLFGDYSYGPLLGPKLGVVPLVIPLYWFMIIYVSYILANLIAGGAVVSLKSLTLVRILMRALVAALIATNYDLSFDPYMSSSVGAWTWSNVSADRSFFGVPFHNFYGWLATSFVIILAFRFARQRFHRYQPLGPHTTFAALAPVLFYLSWWLAHWLQNQPPQSSIVAFISLGIPALAAALELFVRTQDQEITGAEPGS